MSQYLDAVGFLGQSLSLLLGLTFSGSRFLVVVPNFIGFIGQNLALLLGLTFSGSDIFGCCCSELFFDTLHLVPKIRQSLQQVGRL